MGKAMARRKKSGSIGEGDPPWLITFSDMMTLILTFFVLLLSLSVIDERAKLEAVESLSRSFGFGPSVFNPLGGGTPATDREPGSMNLKRGDLAPMRDMLFDDAEKDLNFMENKYVQILSINDQVLFEPGGTTLSVSGIELLDRVMPYLQRVNYPLLVAGHTATLREEQGAYTVSKESGADTTWLLSYRRALSVYRHFVDRGIEPGKLSLEAFGQFHPRYSSNTPEGRQKNRRVDLVLDKRNMEWIQKVEALREEEPAKTEHYYRGFRFEIGRAHV